MISWILGQAHLSELGLNLGYRYTTKSLVSYNLLLHHKKNCMNKMNHYIR